ncbi:MAG: hypothetical protein JOZ75_07420 [Candidatus Dormibacteraeota bacterium]|nr:hypothetical protein [Candidatus Dormibacteraeota bacterium]
MDREKAAAARKLSGAASTSEAVDIALDALISREQLRRDIAAYKRIPPTAEEIWLADHGSHGDLDDDVDWELLYADAK